MSSVSVLLVQAELKNKEVIIEAKAHKQTRIIESEGQRDRIIKEAEGEAQQILSRARGQAQAIINQAEAEAKSVKEIARALSAAGENPTKYLLSIKYIDALRKITALPDTSIQFMPTETAFVQTASAFGMNTIMPRRS
jgi:regulator of protease activity HflC (stomatin/prohibitin superfamily)